MTDIIFEITKQLSKEINVILTRKLVDLISVAVKQKEYELANILLELDIIKQSNVDKIADELEKHGYAIEINIPSLSEYISVFNKDGRTQFKIDMTKIGLTVKKEILSV
jgi:hypothetical protein